MSKQLQLLINRARKIGKDLFTAYNHYAIDNANQLWINPSLCIYDLEEIDRQLTRLEKLKAFL